MSCASFLFPLDGSLWENPAAMLQGCPVQSLIGGNLEIDLLRQRSLAGCSPWGGKELDTTEHRRT